MLSQAIEKVQSFETQLTAIHADLCQVSLSAKMFTPALRFLDIDITAIVRTEVSNNKHKKNYGYNNTKICSSLSGSQSRRSIFPALLLLRWDDLHGDERLRPRFVLFRGVCNDACSSYVSHNAGSVQKVHSRVAYPPWQSDCCSEILITSDYSLHKAA